MIRERRQPTGSGIRRWSILPVTLAAMFGLVSSALSQPHVAVVDSTFTSNIENRQFVDRLVGTAPREPLVFWTKLSAGRAALVTLRRELKLPIWHRWTRVVGALPDQGNEAVIDEVPLTVGSVDTFAALEQQIKERQYFEWRTWSRKEHIKSGSWIVSLHYRNGDPVMCGATPCRYPLRVR